MKFSRYKLPKLKNLLPAPVDLFFSLETKKNMSLLLRSTGKNHYCIYIYYPIYPTLLKIQYILMFLVFFIILYPIIKQKNILSYFLGSFSTFTSLSIAHTLAIFWENFANQNNKNSVKNSKKPTKQKLKKENQKNGKIFKASKHKFKTIPPHLLLYFVTKKKHWKDVIVWFRPSVFCKKKHI